MNLNQKVYKGGLTRLNMKIKENKVSQKKNLYKKEEIYHMVLSGISLNLSFLLLFIYLIYYEINKINKVSNRGVLISIGFFLAISIVSLFSLIICSLKLNQKNGKRI